MQANEEQLPATGHAHPVAAVPWVSPVTAPSAPARSRDKQAEPPTAAADLQLREILERTAQLLADRFGARRVTILRFCASEPRVAEIVLSYDPLHPPQPPGTLLLLEGSAAAAALASGAVEVVSRNGGSGATGYREEAELAGCGYDTLACFPLAAGGELVGVLSTAHQGSERLGQEELQSLRRIAELVAIGLHSAWLAAENSRLSDLLDRRNDLLEDELYRLEGGDHYVAESPAMQAVLEQIYRLGPTDTPVLIRGEIGTGKERLARLLHQHSKRAEGPFVAARLGVIAGTGAQPAAPEALGLLDQASGGTVFLDDVGSLPTQLQGLLVQVLSERRLGRGDRLRRLDVRVVAATTAPPGLRAEEGGIYLELLRRLQAWEIRLPPLRERREDLHPLVHYLLRRHCRRLNRPLPKLPPPLWPLLASQSWPGNVRELDNALERALLLSPKDKLVLSALPYAKAAGHGTEPGVIEKFDDQVRNVLRRALQQTGGRIYGPTGAAALLGLKPTTLQGKLQRYGLR